MSETKFTPGPWAVSKRAVSAVFAGDRLVANANGRSANTDWEAIDAENLANAHLIAAAPELYEMVGRLIDPNEDLRVLAKEAAAILAKARGETL